MSQLLLQILQQKLLICCLLFVFRFAWLFCFLWPFFVLFFWWFLCQFSPNTKFELHKKKQKNKKQRSSKSKNKNFTILSQKQPNSAVISENQGPFVAFVAKSHSSKSRTFFLCLAQRRFTTLWHYFIACYWCRNNIHRILKCLSCISSHIKWNNNWMLDTLDWYVSF